MITWSNARSGSDYVVAKQHDRLGMDAALGLGERFERHVNKVIHMVVLGDVSPCAKKWLSGSDSLGPSSWFRSYSTS